MVLPQKLEYVYIIGNIFVNTQSMLNIIASKCNFLMVLCKKMNVQVMKVNEGHILYHSDNKMLCDQLKLRAVENNIYSVYFCS